MPGFLFLACAILSAACNTGGAPASPEFTALVKSSAETGGRFGESSAALAATYQAFLEAKPPQNMADIERLVATLTALERDMTAYANDVETAIKLMRQLAAEQEKAASTFPRVLCLLQVRRALTMPLTLPFKPRKAF
jgi:hypothetical protein